MIGTQEAARPLKVGRLYVGITVTILALFVVELWVAYTSMGYRDVIGNDLHIYTAATQRLFSDGRWYLDRQLHGPYPLVNGDVLYPPVAALFFAAWIVLPVWLYLLIPIAGLAWLIRSWNPAPWAYPLIALCLLYPGTALKWNAGNPSIYVALFFGLGLRYRWPAFLVLLKPSMFPFALIGIRSRWWWVGAASLAALSLPWLGLTLQYPSVVLDATGTGTGLLYSLADLPMVLIPVICWLGRTSRSDQPGNVLAEFQMRR